MKISKETEGRIGELQLLEQNHQALLLQKQNFQVQLVEVENAIEELNKTKEQAYKIVGGLMVAADNDELKKDLLSRKEIIELRIKNFEKQEEKIRVKAEQVQGEIMKDINVKGEE